MKRNICSLLKKFTDNRSDPSNPEQSWKYKIIYDIACMNVGSFKDYGVFTWIYFLSIGISGRYLYEDNHYFVVEYIGSLSSNHDYKILILRQNNLYFMDFISNKEGFSKSWKKITSDFELQHELFF